MSAIGVGNLVATSYVHNTQVIRGIPSTDTYTHTHTHVVTYVLAKLLCTYTCAHIISGAKRVSYRRLLKMLERTFLKEQVKKREHQKEHHRPREEREKRSLLNRLRGHRDRPGQIIGTAPAPEK